MINDIRNDVFAPNTRFRVKGRSMMPTLIEGDDVIVTPVNTEDLIPGDLVFISSRNNSYIHRFLKHSKHGFLTKGDGHRFADPVWDPKEIRGRVIQAWRGDSCIYKRTSKSISWDRLLACGHRSTSFIWGILRRMKAWLLALLMLLIPVIVLSAVTLVSFEVDPGTQAIFVYWETASEAGNLGFYLWRSEDEMTGYYKLPVANPNLHFIPSADEGAGAFYDYVDEEVTPGILYYYKVQDVPSSGADGEYSQPLSGGIGIVTDTPTPTPTLTPTPTSTNTPTPTPVEPYVNFWAENEDVNAGECSTLQWQTENIKSVFLDGEGVPGLGAKTYCPCADEYHILTVYFMDDTRQDYRIDLTVTGDCDEGTLIPTQTPSPTVTPTPSNVEATETPTPSLTSTRVINTPTRVTDTPSADEQATATLTKETVDGISYPTPTSEEQHEMTPTLTPTRVIVEGHTPRQPVVNQPTGLLLMAALIGIFLFSLGVWFWRSR